MLLGFLIFSENQIRTVSEKHLKHVFEGLNPPDLSIGISKGDLINFFEKGGTEGRRLYSEFLFRYDFLYPLSYGVFFAYTIILLIRRFKKRWMGILPLLPILSMLADMIENSGFILLAFEYPSFNETIFKMARFGQLVKWYMAFLSVGVVISLIAVHILYFVKKTTKN